MAPITVALTSKYNDYWQNCCNFGHEMIMATTIRKIFPTMEFQISGLEKNKLYDLTIHFDRLPHFKYRYDSSLKEYISSTSDEPKELPKIVFHSKGQQTGSFWMAKPIKFDDVRVTCTKELETESDNHVHLLSEHRYQPVLTVFESSKLVHTSRIEHMVFMAFTKYHNENIEEYKRSINNDLISTKSVGEQKVGIVGRKRNSVPASLDSFAKKSRKRKSTRASMELPAKQSRSQDDDEPSTSDAGSSLSRTSDDAQHDASNSTTRRSRASRGRK